MVFIIIKDQLFHLRTEMQKQQLGDGALMDMFAKWISSKK